MVSGRIEDPQFVSDGSDVVFGDKRHWHEVAFVRSFPSKVHCGNFKRPDRFPDRHLGRVRNVDLRFDLVLLRHVGVIIIMFRLGEILFVFVVIGSVVEISWQAWIREDALFWQISVVVFKFRFGFAVVATNNFVPSSFLFSLSLSALSTALFC